MFCSDSFQQLNEDTFRLRMGENQPFRILQLTDLHLGFGLFSGKKDRQALDAITQLVTRTNPNLIVLTGDSIYPFWPQAGTCNNKKQAARLLEFMDGFEIPYALIMGNHDTEVGSKLMRQELGKEFKNGRYSIFAEGPAAISGVGNYFLELRRGEKLSKLLTFLDSNMYVTKWFFDGFDRIHADQTEWCMHRLESYQAEDKEIEAMAFFHMPVPEFKEAYTKMKLGDRSVTYHFGTIAEPEDYFGISPLPCDFFQKAKENGGIKYMFCGHDHVNNISLTYEGIRMTYGMSIDCLGYRGIHKQHIQRGATEILIREDDSVEIRPVPLSVFVTERVRGAEKIKNQ